MKRKKQRDSILATATTKHFRKAEVADFNTNRDAFHVLVALKGSFHVQIETLAWAISVNRAILIKPQIPYHLYLNNQSTLCTIEIDKKLLDLTRNVSIIEITPLLKEIILHTARHEVLKSSKNRDSLIFALLVDHFNNQKTQTVSTPLPQDERALKIYRLVVEEKLFDQSFEVLARKVGASKRTLERIFQNEIGMTFSKWRQLLRLQYSLTLLDKGLRVLEVSDEVGYASSSAFIHAFKGYFGYSPRQYLSTKKEVVS